MNNIVMVEMFSPDALEKIYLIAATCRRKYPHSYRNLFLEERLAVLPLLSEPIQSTLHQIIQGKVEPGTTCLYQNCDNIMDSTGHCGCEQHGETIVQDIMMCRNCDTYGFPCPTCKVEVFQNQLSNTVEDY
jgi:hypothetical protein